MSFTSTQTASLLSCGFAPAKYVANAYVKRIHAEEWYNVITLQVECHIPGRYWLTQTYFRDGYGWVEERVEHVYNNFKTLMNELEGERSEAARV